MTTIKSYRGVLVLGALVVAACGGGGEKASNAADGSKLSGTIGADGSSTVYPITEAMAEEFMKENPGVRVTVGQSGTGGGFKRFCAGEIDIGDASRPIKDTAQQACNQASIGFSNFHIAYDGLSVVVNSQNNFVTCLTTAELKKIWEPESKVKTWADVRAGFPAQPIKLFGPGTSSGTFD